MSISSSVVVGLALAATVLAVLRMVEVRGMMSADGALLLSGKGPRTVFAFATHYFFSVFVLAVGDTLTESSVFLEIAADGYTRAARLCCLGSLVVLTLFFFM